MRIFCFAGPNGSGKSTIVKLKYEHHLYMPFINADNIAASEQLSHIDDNYERNIKAANMAKDMRENRLKRKKDFMFETVMSDVTSSNNKLDFLKRAKSEGAEINILYVLTRDKEINVQRVAKRVSEGGHNVPLEKIRTRYDKCLKVLPEVLETSDNAIVYDILVNIIISSCIKRG